MPQHPEQPKHDHQLPQTGFNPFLQAIMDAATEVAVIATTVTGTITLFNRGAERLLGYLAAEIVGKVSPLHFHLATEIARHAEYLKASYGVTVSGFQTFVELATREASDKREWTLIHKDGSLVPVELVITPMYEHGQITGFLGMATDISERKKERARLQTLLQTIPDLVWLKDPDGVYLFCNTRFEQFFGAKEADIVGKTDYDFVPRELADFFRANDRKAVIADKPSENEEWVTFASDGHRELLSTIKTPMRNEEGNLVGILGIARDITAFRQAEDDLRASELRYRHLFEQNPAPMLIYERGSLQMLAVNEAFLGHYGYSAAEALQLRLPDLYPEAERTRLIEFAARLSGHAYVGEWHHCRKDGSLRNVVAMSHDIAYQGHSARIAVITDVTERKLLEEQLHQSQKMESVGRLAGGVAHDFNNMLTVIQSGVQLASSKIPAGDPVHRYLGMIATAAERSATITRQLLTFSRKELISPRPLDLNGLISESSQLLARLIREDIHFSFRPAADLWLVRIDPSQVDQILMNLVVNARDAMPDGGYLTLETANVRIDEDYCRTCVDAHPGDYVQLTISDTGCGIDRENIEHIFEPFFTTKRPGDGTGLGLATVYGIVAQNLGFITVDSEPGVGTTFRIYLPKLNVDVAPEEEVIVNATTGSGTILLVEDEEMLLWTITQLLEHLGYRVLQASTPRAAIEICQRGEQPIDLILTDVIMPEMNGREMVTRISAIYPAAKVLFMSGYSADIFARQGVIIKEGMHFIQKPLDASTLQKKIGEILG